jgi:hypothetical protein
VIARNEFVETNLMPRRYYRHRQLRLLKSELESVISSTDGAELHVDDVASKTKARVKRYETVFTGHVNPEELYV